MKRIFLTIRERFYQMDKSKLPAETNWDQVLRFQEYTVEYGVAACEFERDWYNRLLYELEK